MNQAFSFDLVTKPWIPCVLPDGRIEERGLLETLAGAHEISRVADKSPLVTASLHRLLLAVLHRVFGPESVAAWERIWQTGCFDREKLAEYLNVTCAGRMDLFHQERPFYQVAEFPGKSKESSACSMIQELSSGNNPTLFDHSHEKSVSPLSPSAAARALITFQGFHLGGLSGLEKNFTDCPAARPISFFVHGTHLFQTLCLNLVRYDGDVPLPREGEDPPAWEQEPVAFSRPLPAGYLDFLTWQGRRVRLVPERESENIAIRTMMLGLGREMAVEGNGNPLAAFRLDETRGALPLRFSEGKALWRDSRTILALREDRAAKPPHALDWIAELKMNGVLEEDSFFGLEAFGMGSDQAKIFFWHQEHLPLPLAVVNNKELLEKVSEAVERAKNGASALGKAVQRLAMDILSPGEGNPDPKEVKRQVEHMGMHTVFWSGRETAFHRFLLDLPGDAEGALERWTRHLVQAARDSFSHTTLNLDRSARTRKALVRAEGVLAGSLKKLVDLYRKEETA
ncbi:MAG: type I-E CRISPR-associated protein Cse1/CasA [Proteobacteria bacterium]|nr:type I-E CRISPR-associated protein Cse1/CasA [Pseudomonadota bacterium]